MILEKGARGGRKYTFLITLSGMALGTGAIGLIPTFKSIGLAAAFILFALRMIQGLCLGGQYGGAITYVAEHVSDERRGYYTGWLQTSPTLGIVLSLIVIIAARTYFGNEAFNNWAWRIPFLFPFRLARGTRQWLCAGRAVLATPVILEIEGIEAGEVPLIFNIPKSLQISTRTSIGPMVVRISESAALELTEALATYWQVHGRL